MDVISDTLHRVTPCGSAPGCQVTHDSEAEAIASALRRAGYRIVADAAEDDAEAERRFLQPINPDPVTRMAREGGME